MLDIVPWLVAMALLIGCSGFFSASEAALFSLRHLDRRVLRSGTPGQRLAAELLQDPQRLLSAVLFWNLVVNVAYFALASSAERQLPDDPSIVWPFRVGSLLTIIFLSEMLPKTVAVLIARQLAALLSRPLACCVRLVDPTMPVLRFVVQASRRVVWPSFREETSLDVADLERAIELSTADSELLEQEQTVLQNIVAISEVRADEAMRPRNQLKIYRAPVRLSDLDDDFDQTGYLFLSELGNDNIGQAVRLIDIYALNPNHLESSAEQVIYVPWCATVADTQAELRSKVCDVAVIVNELGETIGALTIDDIENMIFTTRPSRSERLLNREPIQQMSDELWQATGMTNLSRLSDYFESVLPPTHCTTLGGVAQELLQRIPETGDECIWGPFHFRFTQHDEDGHLLVAIRRVTGEERAES